MKKYITVIISAILFVALFLATFPKDSGSGEKRQVQIVVFGDSVLGEIRNETAIPTQLQQLTGKTVFNSAMGGTCASRYGHDRLMDDLTCSLSLSGLVRAIYAKDFGPQQAGVFRDNMTEYFEEVIDELETIDFESVEMILIQHGINDYHAGVPIENPEDPYDEASFLGALRYSVEMLQKINPDARIVLVTPTYTWYVLTGQTCEQMDGGGGVLEDYVNAEIALAEEMGLEIIDLYHDFLPNDSWEDCGKYTRDGVHPNEAGRKLWAEKIAGELFR